jgi:LysR family transcriptional regulator, cyn operon transcriptional activator
MEIFQLHYFVKLAEVLHFTQAAEACYVTQSGLSQQIKKLEDELGMALFLRIGKKVQLTEAGAIFLHHATRILDDVDIGKQAIDDLNELIGGELKIGVTYVFGLLVLPVVQEFAKKYPDLKIIIDYDSTEPLKQKLINNKLDMVLVHSANNISSSIKKVSLFTSKLVMAVAKTNPLAKLESIPFSEVDQIPLILATKGFSSREYLDDLFQEFNIKPKISIELNAIHGLLKMIENSHWATILTEKAIQDWDTIKTIELEGINVERNAFILTVNNQYQKKAINLFIEAFKMNL